MRDILYEMHRLLDESEGGALVTITHTSGSTYRREGAKMVCRPDGTLVGSISGGCLESDIYELSREVVERNQTELVTYDTNAENDNVWGLGIGCNGTVEVLIEPLAWWRTAAGRTLFNELFQRVESGHRCVVATLLSNGTERERTVKRLLIDPDRIVAGELTVDGLEDAVRDAAARVLGAEGRWPARKVSVSSGTEAHELFIDAVVPPLHLWVVGGGHDAVPMVRMAHELGLRVTLIDSRPAFARPERFPDADRVVCVELEHLREEASFEGAPAVILMTHNFLSDREVLGQLLTAREEFSYIGVLGPRARTEQLLDEMQSQEQPLDSQKVKAIRTPVGLDLGADSPAEIALATLAEVLAVTNKRSARPLRAQKVAVHAAA